MKAAVYVYVWLYLVVLGGGLEVIQRHMHIAKLIVEQGVRRPLTQTL
jgi:hypothetical protein